MLKNLLFFMIFSVLVYGGSDSLKTGSKNITQYYSGKFGFYSPSKELNNGLILGVDGITEFNKFNFFLSGSIDLYYKKMIDIFSAPKPNISDQTILIFPIHINFAYRLAEIPDADTKFYLGVGAGYYFHFYNAQYYDSGGILGGLTSKTTQQNGGNFLFTISGRILIGKIFVEPRYYFATKSTGSFDNYNYKIDPSGFAVTLGFQY